MSENDGYHYDVGACKVSGYHLSKVSIHATRVDATQIRTLLLSLHFGCCVSCVGCVWHVAYFLAFIALDGKHTLHRE